LLGRAVDRTARTASSRDARILTLVRVIGQHVRL
jgi:hypothetical protein